MLHPAKQFPLQKTLSCHPIPSTNRNRLQPASPGLTTNCPLLLVSYRRVVQSPHRIAQIVDGIHFRWICRAQTVLSSDTAAFVFFAGIDNTCQSCQSSKATPFPSASESPTLDSRDPRAQPVRLAFFLVDRSTKRRCWNLLTDSHRS